MSKICFITGGASGLGKRITDDLLSRGYAVGLTYKHSAMNAVAYEVQRETLGTLVYSVQCDVSDVDQCVDSFNYLVSKVGAPTLLINNSGVLPPKRSLAELSTPQWNYTLGVNLGGAFSMSKQFSEVCSDGRIINMASVGGLEIWRQRIDYNVSKNAIIQLTKALARDLAPRISVNCICPGLIASHSGELTSDDVKVEWRSLVDKIPFGRAGKVDDVLSAVRFFSECSPYITGQILSVDGGLGLI